MIRVLGCIVQQHNVSLVALAALLCVFVCGAAMAMMARARKLDGSARFVWIGCAGTVAGFGIWATHFVAMLAYASDFPIGFDPAVTFLSMVIAAAMCGVGFSISFGRAGALLGGGIAGLAIATMHYVGMAAVRAPAHQVWDLGYASASVVFGVAVMAGGMWVAVRRNNRLSIIASTAIFTTAICGMHFTGMTAFSLIPDPTVAVPAIGMAPGTLAAGIAATAFLIISISLIAMLFDTQQTNLRTLKTAKAELEIVSRDLQSALNDAQSANRAKASFFAAMSHELRTPLNAIIGFSELLQQELFGPLGHPRNVEYVSDIHASGLRLLALINDVLDISRMDAGKMSLREQPVALEAVITQALHVVTIQAEKAEVTLSTNVQPDLPEIVGDAQRLEQAILNLLSNAIKFTPEGGRVEVRAHQSAAGYCIEICDSGIGIAPGDIEGVLNPFVQVDNSLARRYEGTGLGLSIAKRLVELHGGNLAIKSTLRVGTTVSIVLPASRGVRSMTEAALKICAA